MNFILHFLDQIQNSTFIWRRKLRAITDIALLFFNSEKVANFRTKNVFSKIDQ